jgi:hypothetical protein
MREYDVCMLLPARCELRVILYKICSRRGWCDVRVVEVGIRWGRIREQVSAGLGLGWRFGVWGRVEDEAVDVGLDGMSVVYRIVYRRYSRT